MQRFLIIGCLALGSLRSAELEPVGSRLADAKPADVNLATIDLTDLSLEDALRAALGRSSPADTRVEMAKSRIAGLQATSRRRFEFRPQLGLYSFSNPLSLVAGLGNFAASNGPTPEALADADIDLVLNQVARERERFRIEAETTRSFYDLWDRQQTAAYSCGVSEEAQRERAALAKKLAAGAITRLEMLRGEQLLIDRESECRRAEREVELAGNRLAALLGATAGRIRVRGGKSDDAEFLELRPSETLVDVALNRRTESGSFRQRLAQLRGTVDGLHETRGFRLSFFASNSGSTLTPGSILQPSLSLAMPIGQNPSFSIEKRLLQLRTQLAEQEIENLEQDIQTQVTEWRTRYEMYREDSDAAQKRVALAQEYRELTGIRYRAGLETSSQLATAADGERLAKLELMNFKIQGRAAFSALVSICNVRQSHENVPRDLRAARNDVQR